jgi:hypothetical protein
MVDSHTTGEARGTNPRLEGGVHADAVAVDRRAPLTAGADEDVSLVDGHLARKVPHVTA